MSGVDPDTVKTIVRTNFDSSAELYESFEQQHRFFRDLTNALAVECKLRAGQNLLDVGCGTGASSLILGELVSPGGKVLGLDFSEEMLELARVNLKTSGLENVEFRNCDANELDSITDLEINSVLYNASIFLIPEPEVTLEKAFWVLNAGGTVGMNYLSGVFGSDPDNSDPEHAAELFQRVRAQKKSFAPYGRSINDPTKLPAILASLGFSNVCTGIVTQLLSAEVFKDFYSIPAQSAALWPKNKYTERLELLDELLGHLAGLGVNEFYQTWGWCIGEK